MAFATHLVKINGEVDLSVWSEEKLKKYVSNKIKKEIEPTFHASRELFKLEDDKVEVWVYISALPSEATRKVIEKWLNDHIVEDGLKVTNFEVEVVASMVDPDKTKFFIRLE